MGYGARAARHLDSNTATVPAAPVVAAEPEAITEQRDAINEKNAKRVRGRGYWREEARSRFFDCRDAEDVRDRFRALWREMEGQTEAAQDTVLAEFTAALRRFGQGG